MWVYCTCRAAIHSFDSTTTQYAWERALRYADHCASCSMRWTCSNRLCQLGLGLDSTTNPTLRIVEAADAGLRKLPEQEKRMKRLTSLSMTPVEGSQAHAVALAPLLAACDRWDGVVIHMASRKPFPAAFLIRPPLIDCLIRS